MGILDREVQTLDVSKQAPGPRWTLAQFCLYWKDRKIPPLAPPPLPPPYGRRPCLERGRGGEEEDLGGSRLTAPGLPLDSSRGGGAAGLPRPPPPPPPSHPLNPQPVSCSRRHYPSTAAAISGRQGGAATGGASAAVAKAAAARAEGSEACVLHPGGGGSDGASGAAEGGGEGSEMEDEADRAWVQGAPGSVDQVRI
jgi:hypothetical protein